MTEQNPMTYRAWRNHGSELTAENLASPHFEGDATNEDEFAIDAANELDTGELTILHVASGKLYQATLHQVWELECCDSVAPESVLADGVEIDAESDEDEDEFEDDDDLDEDDDLGEADEEVGDAP